MVDTLNLQFIEQPANPDCSFCKTSKLGRIVICNTPHDDCFICADCIESLSDQLTEVLQAMASPRARN